MLLIDRSIEPTNGNFAVCYIDGEFTAKRIKILNKEILGKPFGEIRVAFFVRGDEYNIYPEGDERLSGFKNWMK